MWVQVCLTRLVLTGLFPDMDEPPRSDAGQDVVIQLPTDWAVVDGRDSVDDHGVTRYEWALVKGDQDINMKVTLKLVSFFRILNFVSA